MALPYLSIILCIISISLFIVLSIYRRRTGLPAGRVIYSDASQWTKVEKPLYSPDLGLTGSPDYLVRQGRQIVPVEVKSRPSPQQPYDSHIYQLVAYCLLVQHEYGIKPDHGILHYSDKNFAIDFTPALEAAVVATLREMQVPARRSGLDRSHQEERRCTHCGYRSICDQALRI